VEAAWFELAVAKRAEVRVHLEPAARTCADDYDAALVAAGAGTVAAVAADILASVCTPLRAARRQRCQSTADRRSQTAL